MTITARVYANGADLGQLASDVAAKIALGYQPNGGPMLLGALYVQPMDQGTAPNSVDEVVENVESLQDTQVFLGPEVDLSSVDILALDTTPIELAPAPGEGFAIVPHEVRWLSEFGTVAYDNGSPQLYYTDLNGTEIGGLDVAGWRAAESGQYLQSIYAPSSSFSFLLTENAPVVLGSATELTDGDGTVKVQLAYRKVPIMSAPTP